MTTMQSRPLAYLPSFPMSWRIALSTLRGYHFPEALIAGGALRDLALGVAPKDLDIFIGHVQGRITQLIDRLPGWTYTPGTSVPAGYVENLRGVYAVNGYRVEGVDIPVQVIELDLPPALITPHTITERMDFHACRIAADTASLFLTDEALADIRARRVTLAPPEDAKQAARSLRRADRWRERFDAAGITIDVSAADAHPTASLPARLPTTPTVPHIGAYWVKFEGRGTGCVEALNEVDAMALGSSITGSPAVWAARLPYPADPRLNTPTRYSGGAIPSFCYAPAQCAGRSSCPKQPSCTE